MNARPGDPISDKTLLIKTFAGSLSPTLLKLDLLYQPLGTQSATVSISPVAVVWLRHSNLGTEAAGISTVAVAKQQHAIAMSTHFHLLWFVAIGKSSTNVTSLLIDTSICYM